MLFYESIILDLIFKYLKSLIKLNPKDKKSLNLEKFNKAVQKTADEFFKLGLCHKSVTYLCNLRFASKLPGQPMQDPLFRLEFQPEEKSIKTKEDLGNQFKMHLESLIVKLSKELQSM